MKKAKFVLYILPPSYFPSLSTAYNFFPIFLTSPTSENYRQVKFIGDKKSDSWRSITNTSRSKLKCNIVHITLSKCKIP